MWVYLRERVEGVTTNSKLDVKFPGVSGSGTKNLYRRRHFNLIVITREISQHP